LHKTFSIKRGSEQDSSSNASVSAKDIVISANFDVLFF